VTWVVDSPEHLVLRTDAPQAGLLVVRDSFFPGWEARVDGQPTPLLRADVLFRAVPLPAGSHTVELTFRSRPFERGLLVAGVAAALTLLLAALPRPRWLARNGR
jgi:uncharacterized membrane protein YfhO